MINYLTYYPSKVTLHDGREFQLNFNDNQNRVLITETNSSLSDLQNLFLKEGFKPTMVEETKPFQISQGLVKRLTKDWDMHVRFLQIHHGLIAIDAEVETSREFLEHLVGGWISVIFEVTNILQKYNIQWWLWHKSAGNYVKNILQNGSLILNNISNKTEWKPLVVEIIKELAKSWSSNDKPPIKRKKSRTKSRISNKKKNKKSSFLKRKLFKI